MKSKYPQMHLWNVSTNSMRKRAVRSWETYYLLVCIYLRSQVWSASFANSHLSALFASYLPPTWPELSSQSTDGASVEEDSKCSLTCKGLQKWPPSCFLPPIHRHQTGCFLVAPSSAPPENELLQQDDSFPFSLEEWEKIPMGFGVICITLCFWATGSWNL